MKKILCLILICILLAGCSNDVSDENREPQDEITYTYEAVQRTRSLDATNGRIFQSRFLF